MLTVDRDGRLDNTKKFCVYLPSMLIVLTLIWWKVKAAALLEKGGY